MVVDTTLALHTPDTGTAWVLAEQTGVALFECEAAGDIMQADQNENSDRTLYTTTPLPSVADYDIIVTIAARATGVDKSWGMIARHTGGADGNYYYAGTYGNNAGTRYFLGKKTGGATPVRTNLATGDGPVNSGDRYKFELREDSQKLYRDSGSGFVEILSAANDDSADGLDGAGRAGVAMGNFTPVSTDDITSVWDFDDFLVEEVAAGGIGHPYFYQRMRE